MLFCQASISGYEDAGALILFMSCLNTFWKLEREKGCSRTFSSLDPQSFERNNVFCRPGSLDDNNLKPSFLIAQIAQCRGRIWHFMAFDRESSALTCLNLFNKTQTWINSSLHCPASSYVEQVLSAVENTMNTSGSKNKKYKQKKGL